MMKTPEKLIIVMLIMLLGTLSVSGQKVRVEADPGVNLAGYKSYGWASVIASANPIISEMVISSVDRELAAKGLKKVDTDPEVTVVVFGSTESDIHISNPSWSPSLNSIATGVVAGPQGWLVTKGTLVVDILDAKTKNSIWRGTATQTLERGPTGDKAKDAKTVEKPIRNAVKKMFKQFPHPSRSSSLKKTACPVISFKAVKSDSFSESRSTINCFAL